MQYHKKIIFFFKKFLKSIGILKIKNCLDTVINYWKDSPKKTYFLSWLYLDLKKALKINLKENCKNSSKDSIDVMIPTISKDYDILPYCIHSLKNICQPINKIFIVSDNNPAIVDFCRKNNYIFIDEAKVLGYGKEKINYIVKDLDRSGWLLQQLIILSADFFVEKENYFVINSDTVLINKHNFITADEKFIFTQSPGYYKPFFDAFSYIFKTKALNKFSTICHMMIFNNKILKEMRTEIENIHHKKWDEVIISTKNLNEKEKFCFSEFETYPNWLLMRHPDLVKLKIFYNKVAGRTLLDFPKSLGEINIENFDNLKRKYGHKYNSVSFHSYRED